MSAARFKIMSYKMQIEESEISTRVKVLAFNIISSGSIPVNTFCSLSNTESASLLPPKSSLWLKLYLA